MKKQVSYKRFLFILNTLNKNIIDKIIVYPSGSVNEIDYINFKIGNNEYTVSVMDMDLRYSKDMVQMISTMISNHNEDPNSIPFIREKENSHINFKFNEQEKMKMYSAIIYHKSMIVDRVYIQIEATSREDAIYGIYKGDGDWINTKNIDTYNGEFIDEKDWIIKEIEENK